MVRNLPLTTGKVRTLRSQPTAAMTRYLRHAAALALALAATADAADAGRPRPVVATRARVRLRATPTAAFGIFTIVTQGRVRLLERFGKYKATLEPGFHFKIPLVDKARPVTMKEIVLDTPPQVL